MKNIIALIFVMLIVGCNDKPCIDNKKIAMPDEYWRRITGYDSIQLIYKGDSLCANFCYPNKYEFVKFNTDTIYIHDTVYIGITIGHQHGDVISNGSTKNEYQ